jgi:hypothetical protein
MITLCRKGKFTARGKRRKVSGVPNFQERMTKVAQFLSDLNHNFFNFFDVAVKNFCGSSLA